jgi:hypothetical protein
LIHFCLLDQIESCFYLLAAKPFTTVPKDIKLDFFLQVTKMSAVGFLSQFSAKLQRPKIYFFCPNFLGQKREHRVDFMDLIFNFHIVVYKIILEWLDGGIRIDGCVFSKRVMVYILR